MDIESYLLTLQMSEHINTMLSNKITTLDDITDLGRGDLVGIGIPLGDASKIIKGTREIDGGAAIQQPAYIDRQQAGYKILRKKKESTPMVPPTKPEADTMIVITSDKCEFMLSKSLAQKSSGYFRALLDTDCEEVSTGVIKVQLLGVDFQRVHDMIVYPVTAIGDDIGRDLTRTDASKLLYNAKYFQLHDWISIILRNTNECCSLITKTVISDCYFCGKQHLCTEACIHCDKPVCSGCTTSCDKCFENHCQLCTECCTESLPVRDWGKYDTTLGQKISLQGHGATVNSVAFSEDGKLLASASGDKTIQIWDNSAGVRVKTLEGHKSCVTSVAFSKDGKLIASGSRDFTIRIWDPATGNQLRVLEGHTCSVRSICFNNNTSHIASASSDKTVRIWDSQTGHQVRSLGGNTTYVFCVRYSNDGKYLISGSRDKIRIWDANTGSHVRTLEGHTSQVNSVAVSPNSKYLVSGSTDKTIKIWELESGVRLLSLSGHSSWVNTVCYSNDGQYIASCSGDKTIRIWNSSTGKHVWSLEGHSASVLATSFSNNGKYLASCSGETIRLYSSPQEELPSLSKQKSFENQVVVTTEEK